MFIINYKMPKELVDEQIELLQINDIFNVYYESPLDITTDMFGYGYKEKENVIVDLKVAFDGNLEDFENFKSQVSSLLKETPSSIDEVKNEFEEFYIDPIHLMINGFYVPQLITLKIKKKFSLLLKVPLELDYMKLLKIY